jgi:hypothetical protein
MPGEGVAMTSKQSADEPRTRSIKSLDGPFRGATEAVFTRDHELIKQWATERHAAPATGEATGSGPATSTVNDGGAGIRFNFPGFGAFRPISWEEWFENFDHHACAFLYDNNSSLPLSSQYRIVKAEEWKDLLS